MFKNSYKLLFIFTLVSGTIISISSNSWISIWMGLEINLLSFIPLMNETKNLLSSESSLKYFLIQALASSILLFSIILNSMKNNVFELSTPTNLMILGVLMVKSGMAPFHFWFPNIIEGLNWINAFILLTWQKIAPLMLISYLNNFLFLPIILSMLVGSLGGLNQTSLRKIMAYSSINHLGWMAAAMQSNNNLWFNYFLFYVFLSTCLIYYFYSNKLLFISQLFSNQLISKELKLILFMNFLSLGGLPPFLGFYPKWYVIQMLNINDQLFLMTVMVILTLITLYYYIRLCFTSFMLNYYSNKWIVNKMQNNQIGFLIMSFFSLFGLILINLFYFLL